MFEDTSKQLAESHSLQAQLGNKLEENQRFSAELQNKYQTIESDHEEVVNELQNKITNLEGLVYAYDLDIQTKSQTILNLEQNLIATRQNLNEANCRLENEKYELLNLETIKCDLETQRNLFYSKIFCLKFTLVPISARSLF